MMDGNITDPPLQKILNGSIARWALPHEKIPITVKIPHSTNFKEIIVIIPEHFKHHEIMNVRDFHIDGNNLIITKLKRSNLSDFDYFGVEVSCSIIPQTTKYCEFITIQLLDDEKVIDEIELECRIFRPLLEIINYPQSIELNDKSISSSIPLELEYQGFGDISVAIEARIGGKIVSQGESLFFEIILRLHDKMIGPGNLAEAVEDSSKRRDFELDPKFVMEVSKRVQEIIKSQNIPEDILSKEDVMELQKYFEEMKQKEESSEILFGEINSLLLGLLRDILDRNIEDNIELTDPRTTINTEINAPIEHIELSIRYRDILLNEYMPVKLKISVIDKLASHKEIVLKMPIRIDKVKNRPLYNVMDIEMEECT